MQIKLRHVTPLTFILLVACSGNDLNVGTIDDASANSPGTGGTGATGGGGGNGGVDGAVAESVAETGATTQPACDPFAPVPKPITLGAVLAVGQSSTGTIYAVDQVDSAQRVFVSDASGTLVRQGVSGSSSSNSGPTSYVFDLGDTAQPSVLQIDIAADASVRMGVVQGTLKDRKNFVIGQDGEELTVLPNSAIATMPLRNFPGDVYVEYVATLPNGEVMLVTRPLNDWTYADFRLFLGQPAAVTERPVDSVLRYTDGGTTTIRFELDGTQASAYFPVVWVDAGIVPGAATLTVAGVTTPLTRQSTPPTTASYLCL
ncbi:MAG TPA: hypothetical protein VIM14_19610 [Polyangia bacterium]